MHLDFNVLASDKPAARKPNGLAVSTIVGAVLLACVVCLVLANLAAVVVAYGSDTEVARSQIVVKLIRFFDVDREGNLPSWFSTLQLFGIALLSLAIGTLRFRWRLAWTHHWFVLSLLFATLSLDESASLHEWTIPHVRTALGVGGFLYWAWVVPGAIFVLALTAFFWRFVFDLPLVIRLLAVCSAGLYLAGALGLEMVGGYYFELKGGRDLHYAFITTAEESLEMMGLSLFIYALIRYAEMTFSVNPVLRQPSG